jgi:hypothetical protein
MAKMNGLGGAPGTLSRSYSFSADVLNGFNIYNAHRAVLPQVNAGNWGRNAFSACPVAASLL